MKEKKKVTKIQHNMNEKRVESGVEKEENRIRKEEEIFKGRGNRREES